MNPWHRTAATLGAALLATTVACAPQRTIDGSQNNETNHTLGKTHTPLLRLGEADYADGISAMGGTHRRSPREISNLVCDQDGSIPNTKRASDYVWQWGQFLDHDIDLTEGAHPAEPANIPVPLGDPFFDPWFTGSAVIPFSRSVYDTASGTGTDNPRQQLNEITTWIDASNVYGSDAVRQAALRTNDGTGRLATSPGNLLPFNEAGLPNAGGTGPELFLAGDPRANEQAGLTAMHTLFVREHNFWAKVIRRAAPEASGDQIYEAARIMVGAEMQAITYEEFLPALVGKHAIPPYIGYDPDVDARIANEFSGAAYRLGHSMLNSQLLRLTPRGRPTAHGPIALRDAFFAPHVILEQGGIAPLLRGLAAQKAQRVDPYIIDDVRNFLFGPPGAGGFDLASLNIQRGRDHGLPSYNDMREVMELPRAADFADVSSDPEVQARLAAAYDHVDDIDLWVGGLSEDHAHGALVGPLVQAIVADQFTALRDGDRFWYEYALPKQLARHVKRTRLSDVIKRNILAGRKLPRNVFRVSRHANR